MPPSRNLHAHSMMTPSASRLLLNQESNTELPDLLSSRQDGREQQGSIKVLDVSKGQPESAAATKKRIKDEYVDKFKDTVVIKAVERDDRIIRRAGGSQKLHLELHSGPEIAD